MPRTLAGQRQTFNTMKFAQGSFTGNGTSQSITGLGFSPQLVIIRIDSASANTRACFKIASMAGDSTLEMVGANAIFTGGITSLDSDGFSVGSSVRTNESGKTVYWTAFAKNNSFDFNYGTYTGTNLANQSITGLGFKPDFLMIKNDGTERGRFATSAMPVGKCAPMENVALETSKINSLDSDGFTLQINGANVNTNAQVYYWFAFKADPNYMSVGVYVGNAADDRNINASTYTPKMAFIKADTTLNGAQRMSNAGDS